MFSLFCAAALSLALAAAPAPGSLDATAMPTDAQCHALPSLPRGRLPLRAGERLEFTVDVLGGMKAGTLTMETLPAERHDGVLTLPIAAHAQSTGLFSRLGKIDSRGISYLKPHDLHPASFHEDFLGTGGKYWTEVTFPTTSPRVVHVRFGDPKGVGVRAFPSGADALDAVGAFYYLRSIDLKVGQPLCFDVYGARKLWRVWGKVEAREAVSTPAGDFRTLRLSGLAARKDAPNARREVHFWISEDGRRLPVAAVGDLEIGPMRAVLTEVGSGSSPRAARDRRPAPRGAAGWTE